MTQAQKAKIQLTNDKAIHYYCTQRSWRILTSRNAKAKVRVRVRVRVRVSLELAKSYCPNHGARVRVRVRGRVRAT